MADTATATAHAPIADLSSLSDATYGDTIPEQLPEQGGGSFLVVLPQILTLRLPPNLMQCWEAVPELRWVDAARTIPLMDPQTQQQATLQRIEWTFDRDNPLIIVAPDNPELDGQPCPRVSINNIPRKRSNKEGAHPVSDGTYLLRISLGDTTQLDTPKQWVEQMARHAGEVFRVESGLSGFCNHNKTRYIGVPQMTNGVQTGWDSLEDPSGQHGCGKRYYTNDFKYAAYKAADGSLQPGGYSNRRFCMAGAGGPKVAKPDTPNGQTDKGCGAYIRGFFTIERFLPRQ